MHRHALKILAFAALAPALALAQPKRSGTTPARPPAPASAITVETGEIAGARFAIARPVHWNRCLLLLAHGLRGEDRPLVADLFPEHLAYHTLLDEGWIVAKTSYRRNGIIVADGIADLDALRDYVGKKFGPPDRVLVEGESMGGLIATLIAERDLDPDIDGRPKYAGAVAIDAALSLLEPGATVGVSLQPKIPLVFLTNQTELPGSAAYVNARVSRPSGELRPALFLVARDGHVNVNQRERLAALRALNAWLNTGRAALPHPVGNEPFFDATVAPAPSPSQVTPHPDGRGFDARITEVSGLYGNVSLNAQPGDFEVIGLGRMQWFQLTVHGRTYRVLHGRDFSSVKRGEWVAFPNADGFTWLARNFADAAATAQLAAGDTVTIRRYDQAK